MTIQDVIEKWWVDLDYVAENLKSLKEIRYIDIDNLKKALEDEVDKHTMLDRNTGYKIVLRDSLIGEDSGTEKERSEGK